MSGAIIGGSIAAAGALAGAGVGAIASSKAAGAQSTAAMNSAQLQYKASQDALAFQKQQYAQGQQNLAPWLQSGSGALSNLNYLMGIGGQPSTPMQGQMAPAGLPAAAGIGVPTRAVGSTGTGMNSMALPQMAGQGSPVSAGMQGISAGGWSPLNGTPGAANPVPGSASPVSAGMAGIPGSASPASTGMAGIPARSGAIPSTGVPASDGIGGVSTGMPASAAPVSAGMGVAPADAGGQPAAAGYSGGYGSLMQPWTQQFQAPTNLTEQLDPGYQARLSLGTDAMQRSAAARGNLLTGGTAKALDTYAQDYASNEYGNVYNRAFNQYAQNYNQFQNNQANQYNRLASMAGMGQQTANQLGMLGQNAAQGVSSNLLNTANAMGQDYQNAGAANASGYYNTAQAINGGIGGAANSFSNLMMLKQLGGLGGGGSLPGISTLGSIGYGTALGDTTNYNNWKMY